MGRGQFMWDKSEEKFYYALNDPEKKKFPHTPEGYKMAQEYEAQLEVEKFKGGMTQKQQAEDQATEPGYEKSPLPTTGGYQGGPLPPASKFAKGTQYGQTEAGTAFREEQEGQGIKEGVSQWADKYESKDQMLADYLRMGVNTGLLEKEDVVKIMSTKTATMSGGGFGKSSVGAALAFTKANPELVQKVKDVIADLRSQGVYSDDILNNLENMAETDVRKVNEQITSILGATEKTVRTLKESKDIKVETARETKEATTEAGIETERELAPVKATTEAIVQTAKTTAAETAKLKTKFKLAADSFYDITGTEAEKLARGGNAVEALNWMAEQIEENNVDFFDLTAAGKLKNPEVYQRNKIIGEYYARPLSGAAINEKEWKTFRSEVLTKSYLLTEAGKKAAIKRLRELSRNNIYSGSLVTKDKGWYDKFLGYEAPSQKKKKGTEEEEEKGKSLREKYGY